MSIFHKCSNDSCGSSLVSLEVFSPAQILLIVQTTAIRHLAFPFSPIAIFLHSGIWKLIYLFFLLFSALYLVNPCILVYSCFGSLVCSLPLCLFTLFSDLPCFLFKSAIASFLSSDYSILSASSLYSITIQSVLFLLFFIILEPSI